MDSSEITLSPSKSNATLVSIDESQILNVIKNPNKASDKNN